MPCENVCKLRVCLPKERPVILNKKMKFSYSGTPLRPKAARVEPHTHTKRRPKRHAGNFLWSLASGMTRGRVRTYVAFHDILTCSNFCAAASQGRARNRVSLLTRVAQATRVEVK